MKTIPAVLRSLSLLSISVFVAACGSGSSSGSSTDPVNNAPPPANTPPPAPVTAPELSGLAPQSISATMMANESGSADVVFTNSGDADLTYSFAAQQSWISIPNNGSGSVMPNATASISVGLQCGDADLSGSIVLTTNDEDEGTSTIPVDVVCEPLASNVEIARVLLNQGARGFDSDVSDTPSIELIAGRDMLVRAFLTGEGNVPDARVVLSRPGQADAFVSMQTPTTIGAAPADDTILAASHYVEVPGTNILEGTTLRVEVAPFANPVRYPATNDLDLGVEDPGTLEVTFVPVTFDGQTPTIDPDTYIRDALQVLPVGAVDIQVRAPYTYTGAYDLGDLLMEISDLRNLDGSTRLYHAIIIPPPASGSRTAGVGFVGFPVSVSIDLNGTGFIIAHEMGHNLNLGHAPGCDAPNPDPNYPYPDAAIGSWGYNIQSNTIIDPSSNRTDFMSYCGNDWVSDYHFNRAIEHRAQSPIGFGRAVGGEGLVISGMLKGGEIQDVRMLPTDHLVMHHEGESDAASHTFVAWDRSGVEVARAQFPINVIEDGEQASGFTFTIPNPTAAIHHYEVSRSGAVLLASTMQPKVDAPAEIRWHSSAAGGRVQWQPRAGESLVLRNGQGEVVSVDRSGQIALSAAQSVAEDLSVSLVSQGQVSGTPAVLSNRSNRVLLTP